MSADKASFHRRRCVSLACISTQNAVRLVVCLFLVFVHFFIPNSYIIVTEVPARSMSFGGPMTEQELTMRWDRMFLAILGCAFVCLPWREMVVHHLQLRRTRSLVAPTAPTTSSRGEEMQNELTYARTTEADAAAFGGVFRLQAVSDVIVRELCVGGDLGEVQVFVSREEQPSPSLSCTSIPSDVWGAKTEWRQWVRVASVTLPPTWTTAAGAPNSVAVTLTPPVPVSAGHCRSFYVRCVTAGTASPVEQDEHHRTSTGPLGKLTECASLCAPAPRLLVRKTAYLAEALTRGDRTAAVTFSSAAVHTKAGHLLTDDPRSLGLSPGYLCGSVVYQSSSEIREALVRLSKRVSALDELVSHIGIVNRRLIDEWHRHASPLSPREGGRLVRLPPERPLGGPGGGMVWPQSAAALDTLEAEHPVLKVLWRHFLGARAAWAAELRDALKVARRCAGDTTAIRVLREVRHSLAEAIAAALEQQVRAASPGQSVDALLTAALDADGGALARRVRTAEQLLVGRLAPFAASVGARCYSRVRDAAPEPVNLDSFSLLRLYGRGAYGEVYAAKKDDTHALFALKLVRRTRVVKKKAELHLRMERRCAERCIDCPFLVGLRYAFASAHHLVLVLPLIAGGTLQVHIDERAVPSGGLPLEELRWIGAQLALALDFMHTTLRTLHRDVKPSNVLLRHNGYLALTDFGLAADLDADSPPSGKTGTKGYWPPEAVRREPQGASADWWSLGVLLAYAGTGKHPFHTRWLRQGETWDPTPPEQLYALDALAQPHPPQEAAAHGAVDVACCSGGAVASASNGGPGAVATAEAAVPSAPPSPSSPPSRVAAAEPLCEPPRSVQEEGMNFSTLHMPLDRANLGQGRDPDLHSLLVVLLQRDASQRIATMGALRAQPFFAGTEWDLLKERRLPAPYRPATDLVYAKDFIAPLSYDDEPTEVPPAEAEPIDASWDFVCSHAAFAEELADCARTVDAATLLNAKSTQVGTTEV